MSRSESETLRRPSFALATRREADLSINWRTSSVCAPEAGSMGAPFSGQPGIEQVTRDEAAQATYGARAYTRMARAPTRGWLARLHTGTVSRMHDPSKGALPFQAGSTARTVEDALLSRRSIRAFKPDPVPRALVERILAQASRAPSGTNVQPWKVYCLTGQPKDLLAAEMHEAFMRHGEEGWKREYEYYPTKWREPYLARRRKLGWDLYGLLGIAKGEREKTRVQHGRNFLFFGAPVGLIFTIDDDFEKGSWLDYGMFLQSVMLAARGLGLDTCPQAAIASAHEIIRRHLGIPASEVVVCGMSLGYAKDEVVNRLVVEREPVSGFARFAGF